MMATSSSWKKCESEKFIPQNCGSDIVIDGNVIDYPKGNWNMAYGDLIIDPDKYPNGKYKWKLTNWIDPSQIIVSNINLEHKRFRTLMSQV